MEQNKIENKEDLLAAVQNGLRPEYIFFWLHKPVAPGEIGKQSLCLWYPAPFLVEGVSYPTMEHFMMAEKARLFGDQVLLVKILSAPGPADAKKLGQQVKGIDNEKWLQHRYDIAVRGNEAKFGQNEPLKKYLVETKDKILAEASPYDLIWGIGLPEHHPDAENPEQWKGLNLLGFALMVVRSNLLQPGNS